MKIAVVDYGMGNVHSVSKALQRVAPQSQVLVTADPEAIRTADRVVVPGQGALPDCMRQLGASGAREAVLETVRTKPFLGICIGLQMLFGASEEGDVACLGVMPGRVRRFADAMVTPAGERVKVPHMGWNRVRQDATHPLWRGVADQAYFYFVHSYYVDTPEPSLVAGSSDYPQPFTCAVARDNVFAVQFHPEKSGADGVQLLTNFVQWQPASWLARPRQLASAS